MEREKNNQGFTLVELLLYIGVVTIIISGVTGLAFLMLQARVKTQAMNEINYQGEKIVRMINQTIRNGDAIDSPSKNSFSNSISVDTYDQANSPTVFNLSGQRMTVREGTSGEIYLTNNRIIISDLNFQNNGLENAPDSVQFQFKIDYYNPEGRSEYNYSKIFYGGASIRE